MESEINRLVIQLARIRNVEVSYVYDTLANSIVAGLKRRFGRDVRHDVKVDAESGEIEISIIKTAVPLVNNISLEISLEDARKIKSDVKEGEDVKIEIPLQEVGRVAIQRTVDELTHRLREAERNKLFNEFIKKKGEIISGTIHKIEKEEILVNLGPIYGILPLRDQLKTDHHQIGAPFKFYVLRVDRTPIGPRVYLSRTHPEFLKRLLAREVPEIQQNIVEIKGVARIPGVRSKVAVTSHDEKIDPIGACVGYRKVRIQNVTKELSGEKIDVIQWSPDLKVFIARAMSPARVNQVIEEHDSFTVVVPDEEFSKAIGRKGQNVWLASLITSSKLDILKESDYRNRVFSQRMAQIMIETLDFLGEETRKILVESGFTTVVSLFDQPATEVAKVLGWDAGRVEQLKTQIREALEQRELERKLFEKDKLEEMRAAVDSETQEDEADVESVKGPEEDFVSEEPDEPIPDVEQEHNVVSEDEDAKEPAADDKSAEKDTEEGIKKESKGEPKKKSKKKPEKKSEKKSNKVPETKPEPDVSEQEKTAPEVEDEFGEIPFGEIPVDDDDKASEEDESRQKGSEEERSEHRGAEEDESGEAKVDEGKPEEDPEGPEGSEPEPSSGKSDEENV